MLYSDALCISANDKPPTQHLPDTTADVPDLLCQTTFPPLPSTLVPTPRPAPPPTPRPVPPPAPRPAPAQDLTGEYILHSPSGQVG